VQCLESSVGFARLFLGVVYVVPNNHPIEQGLDP
jgi:hypothetical protein